MENQDLPILEQKESVKLTKGMNNKYSWEIKLRDLNINDATIERLEQINNKLKERFGGEQ
ncbi:MAG: hypothetical protein ACTSU6_06720 [Candidatus Njordarchaeales archaeon]